MLQQFLAHFLNHIPRQIPDLLNRGEMSEPVFASDSVLLTFRLNTSRELEEVMDMLEDDMELVMLYHHIPSRQTTFAHSACAYANPHFGQMFKINATTNGSGLVGEICVTIYADLEYMCSDLCHDLATHQRLGFMKYCRTKEEVLLNFL